MNQEIEEIPLTIKEFCKKYPWPTSGSVRKMFLEKEKNGLITAFIKMNKRILVLPSTLFKLIKTNHTTTEIPLAQQTIYLEEIYRKLDHIDKMIQSLYKKIDSIDSNQLIK